MTRIRCWLVASFAGVVLLPAVAMAEPAAAEAPQGAPTSAARRYTLPDGDVKDLLAFIKDLKAFRPGSEAEAAEHRRRAPALLAAAAKKILATEKDQWSEAYQTAIRVLLEARIPRMEVYPEERQDTLDYVKTLLTAKAGKRTQPEDVDLAVATAWTLAAAGNTELAADAYKQYTSLVANSQDERLAAGLAMLEGGTRRLALLGKPLELAGKTMGGAELDWKSYRGKVVLVSFFDASPGLCQTELAAIKLNYRLYHDRGLEVIGICTDRDRGAAEAFLKKEKLLWVVLDGPKVEGKLLAEHYGVAEVPTAWLVDKDGKVVSLWARGSELDGKLDQLLGPAYVPQGKLACVDLQPYATQKLAESFEGTDRPNNLAELPRGETALGGVRFSVGDALIHLSGTRYRQDLPRNVTGIKVDKTFTNLYVLQGAGWGLSQDEGTRIGQYVVHYEDGTRETIPIVIGQDVRDWWNNDLGKPVTRGRVVWAGQCEASRVYNKRLRLYLAAWKNPHPEKKVLAVDLLGGDTEAAPFCVAMTVEESP